MDIFQLAGRTNIKEVESIDAAMIEMAKMSEGEIDRMLCYRVMNFQDRRIQTAVALAELERGRRDRRAAKRLAYRTTVLSGFIGIIGAIIGATLMPFLSLLM